jgi:nicotinamidase-related amidase
MGIFRFTGVYLDACVLDTASDVLDREPESLVRLMEEACSTDTISGAWEWVRERIGSNLRMAISSEKIDC